MAYGTYLDGTVGVGNTWTRGNDKLKPEMTKSTEIGVELSFFKNRLHIDYAYYTNDSYNQILAPRGPQSTGYIFGVSMRAMCITKVWNSLFRELPYRLRTGHGTLA